MAHGWWRRKPEKPTECPGASGVRPEHLEPQGPAWGGVYLNTDGHYRWWNGERWVKLVSEHEMVDLLNARNERVAPAGQHDQSGDAPARDGDSPDSANRAATCGGWHGHGRHPYRWDFEGASWCEGKPVRLDLTEAEGSGNTRAARSTPDSALAVSSNPPDSTPLAAGDVCSSEGLCSTASRLYVSNIPLLPRCAHCLGVRPLWARSEHSPAVEVPQGDGGGEAVDVVNGHAPNNTTECSGIPRPPVTFDIQVTVADPGTHLFSLGQEVAQVLRNALVPYGVVAVEPVAWEQTWREPEA